jgi:hypothetical protein
VRDGVVDAMSERGSWTAELGGPRDRVSAWHVSVGSGETCRTRHS